MRLAGDSMRRAGYLAATVERIVREAGASRGDLCTSVGSKTDGYADPEVDPVTTTDAVTPATQP